MRVLLALLLASSVAQAAPKIGFVGNVAVASATLRAAITDPVDAQGAIDRDILERIPLELSAYYWDHGYPLVKIGEPIETATAIEFPITEGERFRLGNLAIAGDPTPRMRARLHDALQLRSGELFARSALSAERERLSRYWQERGYAYVNVIPLTRVDVTRRLVDVTFEIERGKLAYVEQVTVRCPFAAVAAVRDGALFDIAQLDASKAAIAEAGQVDPDRVVVTTRRGSSDELVIVDFACL